MEKSLRSGVRGRWAKVQVVPHLQELFRMDRGSRSVAWHLSRSDHFDAVAAGYSADEILTVLAEKTLRAGLSSTVLRNLRGHLTIFRSSKARCGKCFVTWT
jgi:hypothetical protein